MTEAQLEAHVMKELFAQITLPPDSFYYALTVVLAGALIWVIKVYIGRVDATLKQLMETQQQMKTMLAVHEQKHEQTEKKVDDKINPTMAHFEKTLERLDQTLGILNSSYRLEEKDKKRGR